MKLYIRKYRSEFQEIENQILFTLIYFKKNVFKRFKHFLINYLFKKDETREQEIRTIFETFKVFEKRIKRIFENID